MSDAHGMADAIASLDDDVSVLTGYVVAYSYLDSDGEPTYGVKFGGEERALGLLWLTVVAQQHLYESNTEWNEDHE